MSDKRELTGTAILLGIVLSVVFGTANAYLGLRVGLTVSASIPAAVVSMGVLRFWCPPSFRRRRRATTPLTGRS